MTTFDRTEHCRRIGAHGGAVTAQRHGSQHMRAIGKAGARTTIDRHGVAYFQGLVKRKGWHGRRRESIGVDLAAGRVLAALAASLALAIITGTGHASAKPGPTVTHELPAGCDLTVTFEDRSRVATCADGTTYGYEPTYRYWDRRDTYTYIGTDAAGVVHTVTLYE